MKKTLYCAAVAVAIAALILAGCLISANNRIAAVKRNCVENIYYSLNELQPLLATMAEGRADMPDADDIIGAVTGSKAYSTADVDMALSEEIQIMFTRIDTSVRIAEEFYSNPIPYTINTSFYCIAKILSSGYSIDTNVHHLKSILYDGKLSDNERQYIYMLADDLNNLHAALLADDNINLRKNVSYDEIRDVIKTIFEKYGDISFADGTPLALLAED